MAVLVIVCPWNIEDVPADKSAYVPLIINLCLHCAGVVTTRKLFTLMLQLKQQNEELQTQLNNQTALMQLLVGRFGGTELATSQLPDSISLPCNSIQALQDIEVQLSDRTLKTNLVCDFHQSVNTDLYLQYFA